MKFFYPVSLIFVKTIYSILHCLSKVSHVIVLDDMIEVVSWSVWFSNQMNSICELLILLWRNLVFSPFVNVFQLGWILRSNVFAKKIRTDSFWDWRELIFHMLWFVVNQLIHYISCRSIFNRSLSIEDLSICICVSTIQNSKHWKHSFSLRWSIWFWSMRNRICSHDFLNWVWKNLHLSIFKIIFGDHITCKAWWKVLIL